MCLQPLSLKDPDSQELLKAVGQERTLRRNKIQASHIYRRSPAEEYEFDRFASYGDEGCIMQHLAAAAMGRAHHMGRREHIRFRPSTTAQGQPHFVVVSGAPAGASSSPASSSPVVSPPRSTNGEASLGAVFSFPHYSAPNRDGSSANSPTIRSRSLESEEHATSSSESLDTFASRLVAASSRYKESLSKSTKGFRERLRTRGGIMQDLGARAREMSAGMARALERMSVETGTDRSDAASSPPGQPSGTTHHPPDHPPDRPDSGPSSGGSPSGHSGVTLSTPSLTPTPELSKGAEH
jgi:E3 ubiquitin-protein ligase RHF